jgi:hypothetical protein
MKTLLIVLGSIFAAFIGFLVLIAIVVDVAASGPVEEETPEAPSQQEITTDVEPKNEAKPKKKAPKYNADQRAAIDAAQDYVDMLPFSKAGLIDQLSSEYGSQFALEDAKFAANHIKVNWKQEAVEAAEGYQELMPMSRDGLHDQLTSEYGDQFTDAQADYAIARVFQ